MKISEMKLLEKKLFDWMELFEQKLFEKELFNRMKLLGIIKDEVIW